MPHATLRITLPASPPPIDLENSEIDLPTSSSVTPSSPLRTRWGRWGSNSVGGERGRACEGKR
eukprot:268779-Chlamydomonas_euryale.AAC.1